MSANSRFLEFITKPGCHLCDEALPVVQAEAGAHGWQVVQRSVLDDDDLMAEYGLRIPVVLRDGEPIAEGIIAPGDVDDALASG